MTDNHDAIAKQQAPEHKAPVVSSEPLHMERGEERDALALISQELQILRHAGPLPDPETLRRYAEIILDGAERIMRMAEKEQEGRLYGTARRCKTSQGRPGNRLYGSDDDMWAGGIWFLSWLCSGGCRLGRSNIGVTCWRIYLWHKSQQ